jgi:two-component system nitrogen regulation sensor histidine kinase NtrY
VLEDHGGRIELKDAADFRPGQRGAWMRLRFAASGHASGVSTIEVKEQGASVDSATSENTTKTEARQVAAETAEKVETTNCDTASEDIRMQAATGN